MNLFFKRKAVELMPPLITVQIRSLEQLEEISDNWGQYREPDADILLPEKTESFTVNGFCWVDQQQLDFQMDDIASYQQEGKLVLNWRERLICPKCGLNSRQRSAFHLLHQIIAPKAKAKMWVAEQVTPLYRTLKKKFVATVGSEFLGDGYQSGAIDDRGIRHEDVTKTSFASQSLDAVMSFDVMEHVPDFRQAFSEAVRILKPNGVLLFTAPFLFHEYETQIRAKNLADGTIEHIHPAQYHGDPVNEHGGVLCYQAFGWDVLTMLRQAGFADSYAILFESRRFGYLGEPSIAFIAHMPDR